MFYLRLAQRTNKTKNNVKTYEIYCTYNALNNRSTTYEKLKKIQKIKESFTFKWLRQLSNEIKIEKPWKKIA